MGPVSVRAERDSDAAAVHAVNLEAFGRPDEARLVERLRATARPYLGLVATDDAEIVGHIVFAPVTLQREPAPRSIFALAPMAVLPAWQRRGIGSALVREGLAAGRAAGRDVVVVVGHPAFYPRFGFVHARPLGIASEPAFPDEAFMVAELMPGALGGLGGVVLYGPEYAEAR